MKNRIAGELKLLDQAARALAETNDLSKVKSIRDKAEAARAYARSAAMGLKIQNYAAEMKLRAERRAGELLEELVGHGGNRKSRSHDATLKLEDLGINRSQSARWRREASVPVPVFEQYVTTANRLGHDITSQGLLRLERKLNSSPVDRETRKPRANAPCRNGDLAQHAKADGRNGASSRLTARPESRETLAREMISELRNHQHQLLQILKPLCDGKPGRPVAIELPERRLAKRILAEFEELFVCLEHLLCDSSGSAA